MSVTKCRQKQRTTVGIYFTTMAALLKRKHILCSSFIRKQSLLSVWEKNLPKYKYKLQFDIGGGAVFVKSKIIID